MMIKLIKLCFIGCLILRVTFVSGDYQNYQDYITALKELEERYSNIDKTIDLSGCTMREVVKQLHDVLQLRAHGKVGTSQEDSYPAMLQVNDVVYELYFHGTENQPGNCLLKKREGKPKAWMKDHEYNSKLNTDENYVEQNLMFCLEIARRKLCCDGKDNVYDIFYDTPILDVIVIGLNLVNKHKECPNFSFFGCFDNDSRKNIADVFIKKAELDDKSLVKLKLEFYNKRIDQRVIQSGYEQYFKNDLSTWIKNGKVVEKLERQNFTHCESVKNLTSKVLDVTNFSERITSESVISAIKSIEFSSLAFKSSMERDQDSIYEETLKTISDTVESKPSVYVLDGNAKEYSLKFWQNNKFDKRKNFDLRGLKNALGFLYVTGKDNIHRWFYLNKSNSTMYLLCEIPKS